MAYTVCFDIDGVILSGGPEVFDVPEGECPHYDLCRPIFETIETMKELFAAGVTIKLHTARWEKDRGVTMRSLKEFKVPFHQLDMSKPLADMYIDDKSYPRAYNPIVHADAKTILRLLKTQEKSK